MFSWCLNTAVPGKLKALTLVVQPGGFRRYLDENQFIEYYQCEPHHLDDVLLPITTLRLCDFYPAWTSQAYHGLVELCLHNRGEHRAYEFPFISQLELLNILSHSPKLRVLDLDFEVRDLSDANINIAPVYLGDLEVVRIGSLGRSGSSCPLSLFSPGSIPLSLSLGISPDASEESILHNSVITAFFARSNIKNMWLSRTTYRTILELLSLAPHSQELALSGVDFFHLPREIDNIPYVCRIDKLYLLPSCKVGLGNLRRIALAHQIKSILVHEQCTLTLDGSQVPRPSGTLALQDILRRVCPSAKWFDSTEPHAWGFPTLYNMGYDI
ncbi:hypothetical protein B0J17DRAFT_134926 [Rhizoctonia solani]|nr:hypothetical protein B0J17DRAFT_134926 [Rhizoctonia solani]